MPSNVSVPQLGVLFDVILTIYCTQFSRRPIIVDCCLLDKIFSTAAAAAAATEELRALQLQKKSELKSI